MDIVLYEQPLKIEMKDESIYANGKKVQRTVRIVRDMKETLMDKEVATKYSNKHLYYMYREVYKNNDIRFDITHITPSELGAEYAKTHGHYHQRSPDGLDYPEVYQIIKGTAVFVLQKRLTSGMVHVIIVDAQEGDPVLLPPGYGHVTVNKSNDELILSNLVYDKFESNYDDYKDNQGAACYILNNGIVEKNQNYVISSIDRISAKELNRKYGFESKNILEDFVKTPEEFDFLISPRKLFKS